jgi:CRISPR/Cas system-associated exonuclease Cas4 (RecB family)
MEIVKSLSFSMINMYSRCGLQFAFRYIEGIIAPPRPSIIQGKAFHAALESNYLQKKETYEDMKVTDIIEIYAENVEKQFSGEVLLDDEELTKGKDNIKAEIKDEGKIMLGAYHEDIAKNLQPIEVELRFDIPVVLPDNSVVPAMGYIDLVSDKGELIDTKTAKKAPSKVEADKSQQLTLYALGYKHLYGHLPQKLRLDYVVSPNSKGAKTVSLETQRSDEEIERMAKRIARIVDGIRKGVFIPPDQGSWACQYCGYRLIGVCKEYLI